MRELYIEAGEEDCYRVVSKKIKKGRVIKTDVYKVDLRNFYCQCDGFWYTHNCIHIRTILEILSSKGIGIVWNPNTKSYYTNWDYRDIQEELKNERFIY